MRNPIGLLLLALTWLVLTGSFTIPNALLGLLLAVLVSSFAREQRRRNRIAIRLLATVRLAVLFLRELVLSAYRVALLVVTPHMDLSPGIFAYRLKLDRNFEITLLANLITLTPGTLSVDVSPDREILFVHAIDCSDPKGIGAILPRGSSAQ